MRLGVVVMASALLLAWAQAAQAEERFDPKQIRVITPSSATSKCIGDPKTPICAVETLIACTTRIQQRLCDKVGVRDLKLPERPLKFHRYRILSSHTIRKEEVTPEREGAIGFKAGNAQRFSSVSPSSKLAGVPKRGVRPCTGSSPCQTVGRSSIGMFSAPRIFQTINGTPFPLRYFPKIPSFGFLNSPSFCTSR
jgi:hypothetical protein